jgi:hypothetical protein
MQCSSIPAGLRTARPAPRPRFGSSPPTRQGPNRPGSARHRADAGRGGGPAHRGGAGRGRSTRHASATPPILVIGVEVAGKSRASRGGVAVVRPSCGEHTAHAHRTERANEPMGRAVPGDPQRGSPHAPRHPPGRRADTGRARGRARRVRRPRRPRPAPRRARSARCTWPCRGDAGSGTAARPGSAGGRPAGGRRTSQRPTAAGARRAGPSVARPVERRGWAPAPTLAAGRRAARAGAGSAELGCARPGRRRCGEPCGRGAHWRRAEGRFGRGLHGPPGRRAPASDVRSAGH